MTDDRGPRLIGYATRTARFVVLHEVATRLLDDLERDYLVERAAGLELDPDLDRAKQGERLIRLNPVQGDGAPLTVLFTSFPGLFIRFGRWAYEAFPACGCDYCNDDPHEVADRLRDKVQALVAGGFSEVRGRVSFEGPNWSESGDAVSAEAPADLPEVPPDGWSPWKTRPESRAD